MTVEVANLAEKTSPLTYAGYAWPALLAIAVWFIGWITGRQGAKTLGWILGWLLLAWAALRCPNGAHILPGSNCRIPAVADRDPGAAQARPVAAASRISCPRRQSHRAALRLQPRRSCWRAWPG